MLNPPRDLIASVLGTTVKLTWKPPLDNRKVKWLYGIYYGVSTVQMRDSGMYMTEHSLSFFFPCNLMNLSSGIQVNTTDTHVTLKDLGACEQYIFTVHIVGPIGFGPSSQPIYRLTEFNPTAPPKNLGHKELLSLQDDTPRINFTWSSSCPAIDRPIGYVISVKVCLTFILFHFFYLCASIICLSFQDVKTSREHFTQKLPVKSTTLNNIFDLHYGGVYSIKVRTDYNNSRYSNALKVRAPKIPVPIGLRAFAGYGGTFQLFWEPVTMPFHIKLHKYV